MVLKICIFQSNFRYRGIAPPLAQKAVSMSLMFGLYDKYFDYFEKKFGFCRYNIEDRIVISTCVAGTSSLLIPFERIQTLLSIPQLNNKFKNSLECFSYISRFGLKEIYTGYLPCLMRDSFGNCLYFGLKPILSTYLNKNSKNKWFNDLCTGCLLGAFITSITFPLNVLKSSFQKQIGTKVPIHRMLYLLITQRNGIAGLYRGISVSMLRSGLSWGIINCVYEITKTLF